MFEFVLSDGNVITADNITLEPHIIFNNTTKEDFRSAVDALSAENLDHVTVYKDHVRLAGFVDVQLIGTQTNVNFDGSVTGHLYFKAEAEESIDPDYKTGYEILVGGQA